jgi:hypothetical protein
VACVARETTTVAAKLCPLLAKSRIERPLLSIRGGCGRLPVEGATRRAERERGLTAGGAVATRGVTAVADGSEVSPVGAAAELVIAVAASFAANSSAPPVVPDRCGALVDGGAATTPAPAATASATAAVSCGTSASASATAASTSA